MRVLLDTNVLLNVLLKRHPSVTESSAVWQAHDKEQIVGHVTIKEAVESMQHIVPNKLLL